MPSQNNEATHSRTVEIMKLWMIARANTSLPLLCAALVFAPTPSANAGCTNWKFSGGFNAVQDNGYAAVFKMGETHNGQAFGTAYYLTGPNLDRVNGTASLNVAEVDPSGTLFQVLVHWENGSSGLYRGRVKSDGRLLGTTVDFTNGYASGSDVPWHSKKNVRCVASAPVEPKKNEPVLVPAPSAGESPFAEAPVVDHKADAMSDPGSVIFSTPGVDCKPGFVWRVARPEDLVCVRPSVRNRVLRENLDAHLRIDPNGAYGPNSCVAGFVWRVAYDGDTVCVTPNSRELAKKENSNAASTRVGG